MKKCFRIGGVIAMILIPIFLFTSSTHADFERCILQTIKILDGEIKKGEIDTEWLKESRQFFSNILESHRTNPEIFTPAMIREIMETQEKMLQHLEFMKDVAEAMKIVQQMLEELRRREETVK